MANNNFADKYGFYEEEVDYISTISEHKRILYQIKSVTLQSLTNEGDPKTSKRVGKVKKISLGKIMKKFLAAVVVAVCSLTANAQVWIGGSLGFATIDPQGPDNSVTTLTIAPEFGYKLNQKWEIGVALEETAVFADDNVNAFYIAPFARYNFFHSGIATLFVDGGFIVGTQNYNSSYVHTDSHTTFGLGFRPGVKIELSHRLALEAKTGYLGVKAVTDSYTSFGFGVNNEELSLGLVYEF